MKNLEKINIIWDNLDESYEKLRLQGESKQEFLNRLIGMDTDGITALDYIEERLNEDLDDFNDEEHKQYMMLLDKFRVLKDVYDGASKIEITSLMDFIKGLSYEKDFQNLNLFTVDQIQSKLIDVEYKPIYVNLQECYDLTGCLGDTVLYMNGFNKSVILKDKHALAFSDSQLYMRYTWIPRPDVSIQQLAAQYVMDLVNDNNLVDYNYLFIDNTYFDVTDTSVRLKIKGCNKYSKLSNVEKVNNSYILDKTINGIKYRIVCFLQK